ATRATPTSSSSILARTASPRRRSTSTAPRAARARRTLPTRHRCSCDASSSPPSATRPPSGRTSSARIIRGISFRAGAASVYARDLDRTSLPPCSARPLWLCRQLHWRFGVGAEWARRALPRSREPRLHLDRQDGLRRRTDGRDSLQLADRLHHEQRHV